MSRKILLFALLLATLPACSGQPPVQQHTPETPASSQDNPDPADPGKTYKILFIGNSLTLDATYLLPSLLNAAGIRNIELARTFHVAYLPHAYPHYADILEKGEMEQELVNRIPFLTTDCLNEKGLYIQSNLRERDDRLSNYGLHSTHGEKTRSDGKPWSELRASTVSATQLVAQNCATVKEAIEFLKNSYDWYTMAPSEGQSKINMGFLIGDATGDWRSEYVYQSPVLDDGRMLLPAEMYEAAKQSTAYDPKIKEYFDDAIKRGGPSIGRSGLCEFRYS